MCSTDKPFWEGKPFWEDASGATREEYRYSKERWAGIDRAAVSEACDVFRTPSEKPEPRIATVTYTAEQINELIFSANYVCDKHEFVQQGGDPDRLALAVARLRHAVDVMGKPEGGANG